LGSVSVAAGVGVSSATSAAELSLRLLVLVAGMAGVFLSFPYALSEWRSDEETGKERLVPVRVTVTEEAPRDTGRRRGR
jgi:hypothetical protein